MGTTPATADHASVARFAEKWAGTELSERAASHEHFIDLCRLVGHPTPATADPTGHDFTFEKPVKVTASASKGSKGEGGFVDDLEARPLRLGVQAQGQIQGPGQRLPPALPVPRRPRQPAALRRLRYPHDRDSHALPGLPDYEDDA